MRMIFKVSYYVRSNYENKQGKSPLMIRIFLNGEMLNVGSSGIYIDKKLWNNSTNRVKGRGSESLNLNAQLDNISNSLQMIFKKHEFDEDLTLDKIKSIFLGKNKVKTTFVEFYDKYLEDIKAQVGAGKSIALYHKYSAARSHFVNFLHAKYGRKDLMPGELTDAATQMTALFPFMKQLVTSGKYDVTGDDGKNEKHKVNLLNASERYYIANEVVSRLEAINTDLFILAWQVRTLSWNDLWFSLDPEGWANVMSGKNIIGGIISDWNQGYSLKW